MNTANKTIVAIVCTAWIALVAFLYLYAVTPSPVPASCRTDLTCIGPSARPWLGIAPRESHGYYHDAVSLLSGYDVSEEGEGIATKSSPIVSITLWCLIGYAAFALFSQVKLKRHRLVGKVSPFLLFALFSGVFLVTASAWQAFYGITEAAGGGGIIARYLGIVAALAFVLTIAMALGRKLRQYGLKNSVTEGVETVLLDIALGSAGLIGCLFLLLLTRHYGAIQAWGLLLIIGGWCWRQIADLWRGIFRASIPLDTSFVGVEVWLAFALFVLMAHNVLELMRPIPIGFDDLGLYMIIPKVLSEQGTLITGVDSYAWGIVMSLGFKLFNSATITLFLSSVAGILSTMAVYAIVKRYATLRSFASAGRYALLASVLFYSLPTIIFQSSKDMKVDLASLLFQLMAVLLFLLWWKQRCMNEHEHERSDLEQLVLIGLFLGMSFVIKYTSLFLVVALGGFVTIILVRGIISKRAPWKGLAIWIVALAIPLLPIIPGVAYNMTTMPTISLATFRIGPSQSPVLPIDPPLKTVDAKLPIAAPTGVREELGRYIGYAGGWMDYLRLPFTVTLNPITSGIYVDIGFVFLAFIPLLVFAFAFPLHENRGRLRWTLVGIGGAYWLLWAVLANGVIWYGYGGLIFLILGVVEVLALLWSLGWRGMVPSAFLAVWIGLSVLIRSAYLPDAQLSINRLGLDYARSTQVPLEDGVTENFDAEAFLQSWIPTYVTIRDTVNAAIKADPKTNVYRVGTFTKYFITDSFARVLDDNQLDVFISAFADHDDDRMIQRFKNGHFRYLIIDTNTATIDSTPEKTLTKKYDALIDFVYRNPTKLKILENDTGVLFVEIL